jgi:Trk K+ transport system NAD-binding subunit
MSAMPTPGQRRGRDAVAAADSHSYIVCGSDTLAFRLVVELLALPDATVTAILTDNESATGARIARLPEVRVVVAKRLDAEALADAGLAGADAVVLTEQDDIGNLDTALVARELAPGVRIVMRMYDEVLAESVRELIPNCATLSATAVAAPAFVAAAVDGLAPAPVRVLDRSVYVTGRDEADPQDVICGLAATGNQDEPQVLPADPATADLVLTVATPRETAPRAASATEVHRRARRRAVMGMVSLVVRRLRLIVAVLLAIVIASAAVFVVIRHVNWWEGIYLAVLTAAGGAPAVLSIDTGEQVLNIVLTVVSIAVIPLVTAAVVETVVSARLALASGGLTAPVEGHVVVVGLGNVGTRVVSALDDLGIAVVGIDRDPQARGVEVARQRRIPVIVGDANRQETLRAASVQTARTLMVLTSNDLANVQTALLGRKAAPDVQMVLRLFDGDFAERIQRTFGFATSRSVSALAAPSFAAAMLGHEVIATISVARRVLLVAEYPVGAGSQLEGRTVGDVQGAGARRVVAIRTGRGAQTLWAPPAGRKLTRTDTIVTVSTRDGLGDLLHMAEPATEGEHGPVAVFDAPVDRRPTVSAGDVDP